MQKHENWEIQTELDAKSCQYTLRTRSLPTSPNSPSPILLSVALPRTHTSQLNTITSYSVSSPYFLSLICHLHCYRTANMSALTTTDGWDAALRREIAAFTLRTASTDDSVAARGWLRCFAQVFLQKSSQSAEVCALMTQLHDTYDLSTSWAARRRMR